MLMRTVRRRAASVALAALLAGCTAWHPYASDLAARPTGRLPHGLRITRTDGSRVMLVAPFVRGDTVLGHGEKNLPVVQPESGQIYLNEKAAELMHDPLPPGVVTNATKVFDEIK